MEKINLNFFGEEVLIETPKNLESLRTKISEELFISQTDAAEIMLIYEKDNKTISINNEEDFKTFLSTKIKKIQLDINKDSCLYQDNLNKLKEEALEDKKKLEELLKKNSDQKKLLKTRFINHTNRIHEIDRQILELTKEKEKINAFVQKETKKMIDEQEENNKKIQELQKKLGLTEEQPEKKNKENDENKKKKALEEINQWTKNILSKTAELTNYFVQKYKDYENLKLPIENNIREEKGEKKEEKKEEKKIELETHYFIMCDGCKMSPIKGNRYKCKTCKDFDFCEACYEKNKTHQHSFNKIEKSQYTSKRVYVGGYGPRIVKKEPTVPPKLNETKEQITPAKAIHFGIKCDKCGAFPIVGFRFQCSICPNLNYCEICEKKFPINHEHPFIKIYDPKTCLSFK